MRSDRALSSRQLRICATGLNIIQNLQKLLRPSSLLFISFFLSLCVETLVKTATVCAGQAATRQDPRTSSSSSCVKIIGTCVTRTDWERDRLVCSTDPSCSERVTVERSVGGLAGTAAPWRNGNHAASRRPFGALRPLGSFRRALGSLALAARVVPHRESGAAR